MALTKVTGHVVKPDTNIQFHNTKSTGIVTFAHTDNATSSTTGALQVTGGVGIVKDLHVGGNITIGGTLTYDDVTNIDSLGIITARGGIHVGPVNAGVATVYTNGNASFTGIITATSFVGDGSGLIGVASTDYIVTGTAATFKSDIQVGENIFHYDDTDTKIVFTDNQIDLQTGGSSRIYASNSALYVKSGLPLAFLASSGATPHIKSGGTNAQDLLFTTGSGNPTRLQIAADGNVGIGSEIPSDKLDVQTGASDEVTNFKVKTSGQLELTRNHASAPFIKTFMSSGNPTITLGDSGGTKTVINGDGVSYFNAGNVGIGSAVPENNDNLTILVNSSSTGPTIRLKNPNGGNGTYTGRIATSDVTGTFYAGINFFKHDSNDGEIRFRTKLDGTNTDIVTIVDGALGIGNLQTAQSNSTTHTSKTKFYIDSTKFTKVARLAAGNITSAGWFTVAKIASSNGNYFKCYASIGGDFTQDMCIIELTGAYSASGALSNAYAEPVFKAHRVGAHSTDRITRARFVKDSSNVTYLQIYIASGHSSYWGKSVLEYTMGTYAQNIADSGSAAMFEAGGSVTNIRTLEIDDNAICVNAGSHKFYSGGDATERLTIDSNGMIGIGEVPKTQNTFNAIEIGKTGFLGSQTGARTIEIASNAYYNSGWKYKENDVASLYYQYQGYHSFASAVTGSADAAVSFSEKLRIKSTGEVHISDRNSSNTGDHFFQAGAFGIRMEDTGGYNRWNIERNYGGFQSTPLVHLSAQGRVGINQDNPSKATLHVVGPSSSGTEIIAKFKGASGADARTKIGLAAAYPDDVNNTEGQAYVGALRNGSGNSSSLFFEVSNGSTLKELARVDNNGINVGGSYRFNNGARDSATLPNTHNIGDVSSNTISYQHNAGLYYVYATIPTDNTWYTMMTSINDSACNFRGVCGDASSKNSFYWYFNPTSPSYGVNPYGEKWHHGSWNTGSVTFRLDGTHPNWNLQIKCTSYYSTSRTASLRAVMEVYY